MATRVKTLSGERIARELCQLFAAPRHSQECGCCTIPALIRPFWGCACNRMRWHYCHLMMPSSRHGIKADLKWLVRLAACLDSNVMRDAGSVVMWLIGWQSGCACRAPSSDICSVYAKVPRKSRQAITLPVMAGSALLVSTSGRW